MGDDVCVLKVKVKVRFAATIVGCIIHSNELHISMCSCICISCQRGILLRKLASLNPSAAAVGIDDATKPAHIRQT